MPQVSGAPQGSITATTGRILRRNAIRVMRTKGVRGRGRRR